MDGPVPWLRRRGPVSERALRTRGVTPAGFRRVIGECVRVRACLYLSLPIFC